MPPGSLIHVGERKAESVLISVIEYDKDHSEQKTVAAIEECFPIKESPSVTWINIDGLHDTGVIEKIGGRFNLHPLLMEDILNTDQRPKMENFEDHIFLVLKMLYYNDNEAQIESEQVSLVLGPNWVITFQERAGDIFNPIRDRIKKGKARVRNMGADYLAYSLLDAVVDSYFGILEKYGEAIEDAETALVTAPGTETLQTISHMKREMIFLRKSIWPLRELISGLVREDSPLINKSTDIYLRDVYDHTIQIIDNIENFRDMITGMLDIYLSSISNRMNAVMKVLTIFASIFIPLTFITGIFGMNFEYMPELKAHWGYFAVLIAMASLAVVMLIYFKRKKWL